MVSKNAFLTILNRLFHMMTRPLGHCNLFQLTMNFFGGVLSLEESVIITLKFLIIFNNQTNIHGQGYRLFRKALCNRMVKPLNISVRKGAGKKCLPSIIFDTHFAFYYTDILTLNLSMLIFQEYMFLKKKEKKRNFLKIYLLHNLELYEKMHLIFLNAEFQLEILQFICRIDVKR